MNTQDKNRSSELDADKAPVADREPVGRRKMLRGAAAAVPAILTLHSGSALAVSSNIISLADGPGDGLAAPCLDVGPLKPVGNRRYDLGAPVDADVRNIPVNRKYFRGKNTDQPVTPQQMCEEGGSSRFYYQSNTPLAKLKSAETDDLRLIRSSAVDTSVEQSWTEVKLQDGPGGLVSANALTSFVGRGIRFPEI